MKDIDIEKLIKSLKKETHALERISCFGAEDSNLARTSLVIELSNLDSFQGKITENLNEKSEKIALNMFGEPSSTRSSFSANFCPNSDKESKQ
jgi:hypothetical protein